MSATAQPRYGFKKIKLARSAVMRCFYRQKLRFCKPLRYPHLMRCVCSRAGTYRELYMARARPRRRLWRGFGQSTCRLDALPFFAQRNTHRQLRFCSSTRAHPARAACRRHPDASRRTKRSCCALTHRYSMVLKQDGSVWTTGKNSDGQLGDGSTTDKSSFAQVLFGAAQVVAAGRDFSMVLKQDGSVWATGKNNHGQLGDGTVDSKSRFVQIISKGAKPWPRVVTIVWC